jgi:hypothetical protein
MAKQRAPGRERMDDGDTSSARQAGPKAQAIVGGGIADRMQADRFVSIELRTLRTHLT